MGVEYSLSVRWDDTTETIYTNINISGWAVAGAYMLIATGQQMPSPSCVYGY